MGYFWTESCWTAAPILITLIALLLFFGTTNRHERFVGRPDSLRLASDLLIAGGSLVGILSAALYLLRRQGWRKVAVASLILLFLGLITNAAMFRNIIGSTLEDPRPYSRHWSGGLVRILEDLTYALWLCFSVSLLGWDRKAVRRAGLYAVYLFGILTTSGLAVGISWLASYWPEGWFPYEGGGVIPPSYWGIHLGRVAWYYILLSLIPFVVWGIRSLHEANAERIRLWLASLLYTVPTISLVGMLVQISVAAYAVPSRRFWPVSISTAACLFALFLYWAGKERPRRHHVSLALAAASISLIGAGIWCWIRGPSLLYGWHPPALRNAWRLILRRLVPIALYGGGLAGMVTAIKLSRNINFPCHLRERRMGLVSLALCPPLISGVLLLFVAGEFMYRIWLGFRMIFPPMLSFAPAILLASVTAFAGCYMAWRILVLIVESGYGMRSTGL